MSKRSLRCLLCTACTLLLKTVLTSGYAWAGLTSALFTRGGAAVAAPGARAGLHIRTRSGRVVRASFPPDHLAFQMGEAMQARAYQRRPIPP